MSDTQKERKILIVIFFIILFFSVIVFISSVYGPEFKQLDNSIKKNNVLLKELKEKVYTTDSLDNEIEKLTAILNTKKELFFKKGEIDPLSFTELIKKNLDKVSLDVSNYKLYSGKDETLVEFNIKGESKRFITFLKNIYNLKNSIRFTSLRFSAGEEGICSVTFRIGYETE